MSKKMTTKKRWLINCLDLTQEDDTSASHISWSSSSSEREDPRNFTSRKKFEVSFKSRRPAANCKSNHNYSAIETFRSTITESPDDVKPSKSGNRHFDESPIIDRLSLEETSPILSRVLRMDDHEVSPVIGKGHALKKRKRSSSEVICHDYQGESASKIVCFRPCDSPDYIRTQSSLIIDSTSPSENSKSTTSSQTNENRSIEPISSQGSSEVVISSYSTNSISEPRTEPVLYYHIIPKKKRYKKGGLASQLQKVLQRQRTSVGIWKHEVYLSKLKNENDLLGSEFVHLCVSKMWTEFGAHLLKCRYIDRGGDDCVLVLKDDVGICVNSEMKLYPPFNTKAINYEGLILDCYYNISRILTCKS